MIMDRAIITLIRKMPHKGYWPKNALKVWLNGLRNGWPLKAFEDRWP